MDNLSDDDMTMNLVKLNNLRQEMQDLNSKVQMMSAKKDGLMMAGDAIKKTWPDAYDEIGALISGQLDKIEAHQAEIARLRADMKGLSKRDDQYLNEDF
jgi:predicted  nucleic acid-binding Zn-ribbon protein